MTIGATALDRRARDAAAAHVELARVGQDPSVVERRAGGRRVDDVDVLGAVGDVDVDRPARRGAGDDRHRRRRATGRAARRHDDLELDLLARGVAEAHLELAVHGEDPDLVGHVGQEEHGDVAARHLREVGVELAAERDVVAGEVELADDEELAVGGDLHDHLAVEDLLRGVDRVDLRRAGDRHRRGERRQEAVHARVVRDPLGLQRDLLLQAGQPLVGGEVGRQPELRVAQRERVLDRRERLEELDARGEVVDRQTGVGLEQDAAGDLDADERLQRAELAEADADREAGHAGHREAALEAEVEDALEDGRLRVEDADDVVAGVELEDAAHQAGVDLPAEQVALDANGDRVDRDDGELALGEQRRLDLDALDRARDLQARQAGDRRDARRQGEDEVLGVVLDVVPLDADGVDPDGQERRPLEAVAGRRPDAQEDAEALLRLERAVAHEREVARLAGDLQAADLHLRADRLERDELLVVVGAGVELDLPRGQRHERAERDLERVDLELEAVDLAAAERQLQADRLGVLQALGVEVVGGLAVADRRRDRAAGQELHAAGGHEDRAVELDLAADRHVEVADADADVVELEDVAEADLRVGRRRRQRVRGALGHAEAVRELGRADREAVPADAEAGDDAGRRLALGHVLVMAGRRVEGPDLPGDVERRHRDRRAVDADDLLGDRGLRVVLDLDALGLELHDAGDLRLERRDAQAELAGGVDPEVAAQQAERVDLEVERAEDAEQVDLDAALLLRGRGRRRRAGRRRGLAEREARAVDADRDRQHEHAVREADVGDADARALQRQRADADRLLGRDRARRRGRERELLLEARDVLRRRCGAVRARRRVGRGREERAGGVEADEFDHAHRPRGTGRRCSAGSCRAGSTGTSPRWRRPSCRS